jgi:superoxide dismutase
VTYRLTTWQCNGLRRNLQALEPHISAQIMELHHSKHHKAYVDGLNTAETSYGKAPTTQEKIALQAAIKFNGGGEYMCSITLESRTEKHWYVIHSRSHQSLVLLEDPGSLFPGRRTTVGW